MRSFHQSVLLQEVIENLKPTKGKRYIDATIGGGGHTEAILKKGGRVLALDWDKEAVIYCAKKFGLRLKQEDEALVAQSQNLVLIWSSFTKLREVAEKFGFEKVDGILFDLGISSHQLREKRRGFSFQESGPLDMRMDPTRQAVTAADLINKLERRQLEDLFFKYSQEKYSRAIADALAHARLKKPIETTEELAQIVRGVVPKRERIDPATRVFMALRIVVNSEILNLEEVLPQAVDLLDDQGKLLVISFHSLEDRIVKNFMRERSDLNVLIKRPIIAKEEEVLVNPRSRGAKLRIAQKIH